MKRFIIYHRKYGRCKGLIARGKRKDSNMFLEIVRKKFITR